MKKENKAVLKELCDNLNKRKVAAVLNEETEEPYLSLVLDGCNVKDDVFLDIAFMPVGEEMNGISFCVLQSELKDMSDTDIPRFSDISVVLAVLNSTMTAGSYSVEITEGEEENSVSAGLMKYRYVLPIVPEISGKDSINILERALSMAAFDLQSSLPGLYEVIDQKVSIEEYMKGILGRENNED